MNVKELIDLLQTHQQDLQVGYRACSEYCLLESEDISISEECVARPDGWIQRKRPDMLTQTYLMFPGD